MCACVLILRRLILITDPAQVLAKRLERSKICTSLATFLRRGPGSNRGKNRYDDQAQTHPWFGLNSELLGACAQSRRVVTEE